MRSLDLEQQTGAEKMALVTTHLNLCAVQAKLEKFEAAIQNAMDALDLTTQHVRAIEASDTGGEASVGDYTCLAVAYLNIGTCREKLRRWSEAAMAYRQGFEVSSRCLGLRHPLTLVLADNSGADVGNDFRVALPLPGIKPAPSCGPAMKSRVTVQPDTFTSVANAWPGTGFMPGRAIATRKSVPTSAPLLSARTNVSGWRSPRQRLATSKPCRYAMAASLQRR